MKDIKSQNEYATLVIVENKADLVENREVMMDEAKVFADSRGLIYLETSAKDHNSVEAIFRIGAGMMLQKLQEFKEQEIEHI